VHGKEVGGWGAGRREADRRFGGLGGQMGVRSDQRGAPSPPGLSSLFSLEDQLSFYVAYHSDRVNKAIHVVFIPTIAWTVLVLCAQLGPGVEVRAEGWGLSAPALAAVEFVGASRRVNLSHALLALYALYYLRLDPVAGSLAAPILAVMTATANATPMAPTSVLALHVAAWVAQFVGHGVFEKKRPALVDSLFQAFLIAPFFALLEVLFALGYRQDLALRVDARAAGAGASSAKKRG